jgi:DNA invertase Pin-like site-specific DNA recombinase
VLAKKRYRLFRSRLYQLLWDQDLEDRGVKLVALDDTGNRFGDAMQDEFAAWEREEIAKRTHDELLEKCRSGLVIKRKRAAYGYQASDDGTPSSVRAGDGGGAQDIPLRGRRYGRPVRAPLP